MASFFTDFPFKLTCCINGERQIQFENSCQLFSKADAGKKNTLQIWQDRSGYVGCAWPIKGASHWANN